MAQGFLTTHVLDTSKGVPAAGLTITLYRLEHETRTLLSTMVTNSDGRTDQQILPSEKFAVGTYELVFDAGGYLEQKAENPFLGEIPIRFGISDLDSHYHVPLLLSPFGYSTYRGS